MKKIALSFTLLFAALTIDAQDFSASFIKGRNGKVHTSYLTNSWKDNIFVGGAFGLSTRFTVGKYSDITKIFINPSMEITALKWITPEIGVRVGLMGLNGREGLDSYTPYQINHTPFPYKVYGTNKYVDSSGEPGVLYYGFLQANADIMWNMTNSFEGYTPGKFYNACAYVSGGFLSMFDNKTESKGIRSEKNDREFVLGLGCYNTFRLRSRIVATADLRFSTFASRYKTKLGIRTISPSLTFGAAYNLFKTHWKDAAQLQKIIDRANNVAREAKEALKKAEQENSDLSMKIEKLNVELKDVMDENKALSYQEMEERAAKADLVVYFYINESELNFSEIHHLTIHAEEILKKDPDHVFYITGSADKGTGTQKRNNILSYERALVVKKFLMEKFNVKTENIIISNVVTDKHADGALDRCALIESKKQ